MSVDPSKFSKLLKSAGYTGRLSDKKIKDAFRGREDVFAFITSELSKDNLVEPEKVHRLEELKRKGAARNLDSFSDEELDDEGGECLGPWEKVENVLMPEESLEEVEKDTTDNCGICEHYKRKREQLAALRDRLQDRIQESNRRFDSVSQSALDLESLVASAREDARNASAAFESKRREYDQLLRDFKELLENRCELWFFPQADLNQFWAQEKVSTAAFTKMMAKLCGNGSQPENEDPIDSPMRNASASPMESRKKRETERSATDLLLEESMFQDSSWFKELKAMQVYRGHLAGKQFLAKRKLACAEAKHNLLSKWREMIINGKDPSEDVNQAELERRLEELTQEKEALLEQYPQGCMDHIQVETRKLVIRQHQYLAESWRSLNNQKRKLLQAMSAQATRFKIVEYLTLLHSDKMKKALPDISYLHHQLEDLMKKTEHRCSQYSRSGSSSFDMGYQDLIPPNDTLFEQINRVIELGKPIADELKSRLAQEDMQQEEQFPDPDPNQDLDLAPTQVPNSQLSGVMRTPTNPRKGQERDYPTPIFSPQTPCILSPDPLSSSPYIPDRSPLRTGPNYSRLTTATVSGLCSNLEELEATKRRIIPLNSKLLSDSKDGIIHKEKELALHIGKMYAMVFKERTSQKANLSTSTVVDNFEGAENLLEAINTERTAISESFETSKIQMRGDTVKTEQRMMMCNFFVDPKVFHGKLLDRTQEADILRKGGMI